MEGGYRELDILNTKPCPCCNGVGLTLVYYYGTMSMTASQGLCTECNGRGLIEFFEDEKLEIENG